MRNSVPFRIGSLLATLQSNAPATLAVRKGRLPMAATPVFTCVCGTQRKTSNHWILAVRNSYGIKFTTWDWNLALSDNVIVLCGEGCAASLLSRSLGEWNQISKNPGPSSVSAAA